MNWVDFFFFLHHFNFDFNSELTLKTLLNVKKSDDTIVNRNP